MTNPLREGLPERPARIARLPVDKRGFPVPRFVALIDGEPDHRVIEPRYMREAVTRNLCWVCGEELTDLVTFTVGPMCTINRVSSEPPSHLECARYAVQGCPFLSKPHAHRREAGLPDGVVDPAGIMIRRNPGAMCLWTSRGFIHEGHPRGDGVMSLLFFFGDPEAMEWFTEGRAATRIEVDAAIASGLPALQDVAQRDGPTACFELGKQTGRLISLLDWFLPRPSAAERGNP